MAWCTCGSTSAHSSVYNAIKVVVQIVLAVQIPIPRVHTHMACSCSARTALSWSKWSKVFNLCTECFSNRAHMVLQRQGCIGGHIKQKMMISTLRDHYGGQANLNFQRHR